MVTRMITLRDLYYLVMLAECQHFGKAANACYVSQPALSMQIKKLEHLLNVTLLERNKKSMLFTDIGFRIAEKAKIILQQVDEIREMAALANNPFHGELKIGIIPTLAPYFLPRMTPVITDTLPQLILHLTEEKTERLLEWLTEGKLDAVIIASANPEENFIHTPLFQEEFMLVMKTGHPLSKKKSVAPNNLAREKIFLLEEGHCLREQALTFCTNHHADECKNFRATSLETLRHMVASGAGITLMPKIACFNTTGVCYRPFEKPKPSRNIAMLWRRSTPKQAVLETVAPLLQNIMIPL